MPAEWRPHERCWMAWPCRVALWGERLSAARRAYASVAKAIAAFEPVTMVANPADVAEASLICGAGADILALAIDDSWARDTGPTFVADAAGAVAGVSWRFNGWGGRYHPHDDDAALAGRVLSHLGLGQHNAPIVLEGGALAVDGEGTLIATETSVLNPNRNPGMDRQEAEDILAAYLGVRKFIWLAGGLAGDETDGHVDNVACFARPGVVLALANSDPSAPDAPVLADNLSRLRAGTDADGRDLEVIEVPRPRPRELAGRPLMLSYINFYIANGGLVLPAFEDASDDRAMALISKAFGHRRAVSVAALDIVLGGGGIHCITQQQPRRPPAS